MLREWRINDFKSFQGQARFRFAPITVFAGANSSGKSSILQSILLLKQTLKYGPSTRSIALNGPLLKLGSFSDVHCHTALEDNIKIGFLLEANQGAAPSSNLRVRNVGGVSYLQIAGSTPNSIELELAFSERDSRRRVKRGQLARIGKVLEPDLEEGFLNIKINLPAEDEIKPSIKNSPIANISYRQRRASSTEEAGISSNKTLDAQLPFQVADIDNDTKREVLRDRDDGEVVGCSISHFLPNRIGFRYDVYLDQARKVSRFICERYTSKEAGRDVAPLPIPKSIQSHILSTLRKKVGGKADQALSLWQIADGVSVADFVAFLNSVPGSLPASDQVRYKYLQAWHQLESEKPAVQRLWAESKGQLRNGLGIALSYRLQEGCDYVDSFFTNATQYLGPLRDEPKPIYPLEALGAPTEVGYRGEHTAAVLDLNQNVLVEYLPPNALQGGSRIESKKATLKEAVIEWLTYLGVASGVETNDQGKFGHQLQVRSGSQREFHDLTNVGVGVSQVLPIIVMALLASKPCLLIFEQPELHLHPKTQARLGDFFLSLGLAGKQCLLETHSEYLIDRFRLRIAETAGSAMRELIKIYFVEQESGASKCVDVEITEFGAIPIWPKDFFDQSKREIESLLLAARRKRESNKNQM